MCYNPESYLVGLLIGKIEQMKDNETKLQFRKRVYDIFVKNGFNGSEDELNFILCEFSGECDDC